MNGRHATDLFSAAYDGVLSEAERRRYDAHLAACQDCAAAAERFRASVDAVRALPAPRMPQRVVLPTTPPQTERRRLALPAWLPRPQLTPAWSATAVVAAGLVAVVLVTHTLGGGGRTTTEGARSVSPDSLQNYAGSASAADRRRAAVLAGLGTCPLPLAVIQGRAAAVTPTGFDNHVSVGAPQRPGQELVVATTSTHYAPGSQVLIYAALTGAPSQGLRTVVVPCISLHPVGAMAYAGPSGGGSVNGTSGGGSDSQSAPVVGAARGSLPHLLTPEQVQAFAPFDLSPALAVASPTAGATTALPLQVVQIPANTPPGTRLQLLALIPAGLPGASDTTAMEAVLTIDVS